MTFALGCRRTEAKVSTFASGLSPGVLPAYIFPTEIRWTMKIVCNSCSRKIEIPDEKVPKGKTFSITCPGCKEKISVNPEAKGDANVAKARKAEEKADKKGNAKPDVLPGAEEGPAEDPFAFLEEGAKTAIICEENAKRSTAIKACLEKMGYHTYVSPNPRDTLKQMRYRVFDVVVVNESFGTRGDPDTNHVVKYLSQLQMVNRRNMFVCMLSERFKTGDNMQAFNKSVNAIISLDDMDDFEKLIDHLIKDNDLFYKTYRELLKELKGI